MYRVTYASLPFWSPKNGACKMAAGNAFEKKKKIIWNASFNEIKLKYKTLLLIELYPGE